MPKEFKYYCCEICGRDFENLADAEYCEEHHKIVKEIVKSQYGQILSQNAYPDSVLIRFTDNTEEKYYRRGCE